MDSEQFLIFEWGPNIQYTYLGIYLALICGVCKIAYTLQTLVLSLVSVDLTSFFHMVF